MAAQKYKICEKIHTTTTFAESGLRPHLNQGTKENTKNPVILRHNVTLNLFQGLANGKISRKISKDRLLLKPWLGLIGGQMLKQVQHDKFSRVLGRNAAFTLAETLIALAVIGIVAALTIPGIVKNYNQKAWGHAQDVFARKLDVALKEMNTEGTLTGYRTTEDFVNELKKNIKITKVCTGSQITNCFADKVVWSEGDEPVEVNESNLKYNQMYGYDWAETVGVQFSNGVNALIGYNKNCSSDPYNNQYSPSASCIGIIYDVSGFKKPNSNGKDIVSNSNLTLGCAFKFTYGGESVCFTKVLAPGEYEYLSSTDCTNSKAVLGLDYCWDYGDYFAGTAYMCDGKNKMASVDQLELLAKYLYNTNNLSTRQGSLKMQENRLGPFSAYYTTHTNRWSDRFDYENFFSVWAGIEESSNNAVSRVFFSSYTNTDLYNLSSRGTARFAVCVK